MNTTEIEPPRILTIPLYFPVFCLVNTDIPSVLFGEYRDIHVDISTVFCLVSTDMPAVLLGEYRHLFGFTVCRFYSILLTGLYRLNIYEGFPVSS